MARRNCGCCNNSLNNAVSINNCNNSCTDVIATDDAIIIVEDPVTTSDVTYSSTDSSILANSGCQCTDCNCSGIPVYTDTCTATGVVRELCYDEDGCATSYPVDCRNTYWPSFSKPTWLSCDDLYCNDTGNTYC